MSGGVYKVEDYDYFEDEESKAKREEKHQAKMDRMRAHKSAYLEQEAQKELRKTNPALQEAWERYQTILKLVDDA